jgi:retron-type reverse transcriptase
VVTVLNTIYEEDFLGFSDGFRPGRSQHDALDALTVGLRRRKVGWVLDLDVRGFFDNVAHEWLGFTHICGKTRKGNWFKVKRQTVKKRLRSKLQAVRQELRKRWHERVDETGDWLRSVVQGYCNYHAVPGNFGALQTFRREVVRAWLAALRHRSQRHRLPWERFRSIIDRYLPLPRILHPEPGVRFDAKYPR